MTKKNSRSGNDGSRPYDGKNKARARSTGLKTRHYTNDGALKGRRENHAHFAAVGVPMRILLHPIAEA